MCKVAVIKDYYEFSTMIGGLLSDAGHEVFRDTPPVNWDGLLDFNPDLVVIGFFRRRAAYNRPIEDFDEDILGGDTLKAVENYPAIRVKPILVVGNGVEAHEIPHEFRFDAFIYFPDEMNQFLPSVDELGKRVGRRRFSEYHCPTCHSRLTYTKQARNELFCPRCHTGVSIMDDGRGLVQAAGTELAYTCPLADLKR